MDFQLKTPYIIINVILSLYFIEINSLFVKPPYTTKPYPNMRLTSAEKLGIPYGGIAYDAGKAASLPSFSLSLNAEFGSINFATFKALQRAYCGWSETKSKVKWKQDQSYTLLDFLPPILQAVNGLHFQSTKSKQDGLPSFVGVGPDEMITARQTEQDVLLAYNCWGFAWEVLFQADNKDVRKMTVSTADPSSAWNAFTGRGFDLIQTTRNNRSLLSNTLSRNRKLRAGDVLLIWHDIPGEEDKNLYLDHVTIVLDKDLYYEKSGSGDNTPFRITTWEGLTANWPVAIFNWEWRRLRRNNLLSMTRGSFRPIRKPSSLLPSVQSASDTFGLDQKLASKTLKDRRFFVLSDLNLNAAKGLSLTTEQTEDGTFETSTYTGIWVPEDIVFDDLGRAKLPTSAFTSQYRLPPFLNIP